MTMTRKELLRLMPVDKEDVAAASQIVKIGFPTVTPVVKDMIRSMQVADSPVADVFASFFSKLGEQAVGAITEGLWQQNCVLRHTIIANVVSKWSLEAVRQIAGVLTMIATQPDDCNNDLCAILILLQHDLVDLQWVGGWVAFKKERWADRNDLLLRIEKALDNPEERANKA